MIVLPLCFIQAFLLLLQLFKKDKINLGNLFNFTLLSGLGFFAAFNLISLYLFGQLSPLVVWLQLLGLGYTGYILYKDRQRVWSKYALWAWLNPALIAFFIIFFSLILLGETSNHGEWDAWAIWNLRARFLFRGGPWWDEALNMANGVIDWTHLDYPLMLPLLISGLWSELGGEVFWVHGLAATLTFTLIVAFSCNSLLGRAPIWVVVYLGFVLFNSPVISVALLQYADVLLTLCFLTAFICFYEFVTLGQRSYLVLSGWFCSLAVFAKNEGMMMALAFMVTVGLAYQFIAKIHWKQNPVINWLAGFLPIFSLVVFNGIVLGGSNDLLGADQSVPLLDKLFQFERHRAIYTSLEGHAQVFSALIILIVMLGYYYRTFKFSSFQIKADLLVLLFWSAALEIQLLIFPLLLVLSIRVGLKGSRNDLAGRAVLGLIPLLVVGGYWGVFVLTPHDLNWHLSTAADRVFVHLVPVVLYLGFSFWAGPTSGKKHKNAL